METSSIHFSPQCSRISDSRRPLISSATPQPRKEYKKGCTRFKSSLKRFPILQNVQIPDHVPKCIKVNSIFKSLSTDVGKALETIERKGNLRRLPVRPADFQQIYGYRTKVKYYKKVHHELSPQKTSICKDFFGDFGLSLRGTNYSLRKEA